MADIITRTQRAALINNAQASITNDGRRPTVKCWDPTKNESVQRIDHYPVVRLFSPDTGDWWLLVEMDPFNENQVYGLTDTGTFEVYDLAYIVKRFQLVR